MRSLIALSLTTWIVSTTNAANSSFPYIVKIKTDGAELRSGPGDEYYATQKLDEDVQVEVYRRESNGWLAIRPPANSFSWVSASNLRPTDDPSIAEVVGLRTVSWIGSESRDVRNHKWQVRLKPDEQVEVLGRASLQIFQGSGVETVARIAPPAGEFRWIHEAVTRRQPAYANSEVAHEGDVQPTVFRGLVQSGEGPARPDSNELAALAADGTQATQPSARLTTEIIAIRSGGSDSNANIEHQIKQVDLDLALEITRPPLEWNFAPARQQIGELLVGAQSTVARARARRIQQKVEEFELLRIRYIGLGPASNIAASTVRDLDTVALAAHQSTLENDPRFDGRGWLLPVHSKKRESPPYALLDDAGKILQFVTPAPGLNLHRYLRRRVGIVGQKAPTSFLDKPQLTAHRVVDLARHRR